LIVTSLEVPLWHATHLDRLVTHVEHANTSWPVAKSVPMRREHATYCDCEISACARDGARSTASPLTPDLLAKDSRHEEAGAAHRRLRTCDVAPPPQPAANGTSTAAPARAMRTRVITQRVFLAAVVRDRENHILPCRLHPPPEIRKRAGRNAAVGPIDEDVVRPVTAEEAARAASGIAGSKKVATSRSRCARFAMNACGWSAATIRPPYVGTGQPPARRPSSRPRAARPRKDGCTSERCSPDGSRR